jgi:ABC-type transport system substrate-binding protein
MNPRVVIAVLLVALVVAGALVLRPSAPTSGVMTTTTTTTTTTTRKPAEIDPATLAAAKKAAEASTKQAAAVQASASKVAAEVEPVLEGYSFLTNESELILSYAVNFDPQQNRANTSKFAAALAKNWKIKELEVYSPKKVTVEFYGGKERIKATRSFDPSGKPL